MPGMMGISRPLLITVVIATLLLFIPSMSIYRNAVWIVKGLREYTKNGYLSAAENFTPGDLDVDCSGNQYLITGSNSGIGKQTALEIARRGGTVHMVCRNPITAEEARKEIVDETKNDNVHVHILDLSNPKGVHQFATKFVSENQDKGLSVLVNNAGCMVNTRELTEDGLEKNFATNTLGTYILTESLSPLLLQTSTSTSRSRVVTVSSGGMLTNKMDPTDLQTENKTFDGTMVYAQNKRQQIIITEQWAKKYSSIQFTTMHPGWADTPAVRTSMPDFYEKMKDKLRTTEQGADTAVWLAVSESNVATGEKNSGEFYQDRQVVSKHLPLAWSRSSAADETSLMEQLDAFYQTFTG